MAATDGTPRASTVFGADDARACVFAHRPGDDKYGRGVVGFVTGSAEYPGAARLGVEAAARAGCGMVRYLGPDAVGAEILRARPETVLGPGRCTALVAGSGIGDLADDAQRAAIVDDAVAAGVPVVLDAGALALAPAGHRRPGGPTVLTPHARELARLARRILDDAALPVDEREAAARVAAAPEDWAARLARATGAAVLLKGATTVVVSGDGDERLRVDAPTSVLATAGTGDVLAGVIGALLAVAEQRDARERPSIARLAASGAWIHGRAALLASARAVRPSTDARLAIADGLASTARAPVTAIEVAAAVPAVIGALLQDGAVA